MKIMKLQKWLSAMAVVVLLPSGAGAESKAKPTDTETFDLKFPGGSPTELLAAIESAGGKVNALVQPGMEKLRFPKMDFRGVTTANVLNAVSMLDSGRTARWLESDRVWVLTAPSNNRRTQVFYVGNLLAQLKIDDITTAIQTTWQMAGKPAAAEMKFHEETKLLIVLGESQQLESVTEVLGQLMNSISNAPGKSPSAPKSAKEPAPGSAPSAQ
jgi:hypothetical protein